MDFFKVHGNGNDFIVLDNREGRLSDSDLRSAAMALCRRRASMGADASVPASTLGHELGVSRQIVVGDVALLRAH